MLPLIISIFALVGQAAAAAAECSRSQLQQAAESYIAAVKSGSAALDVGIYTENFAPGKLGGGIHSKPIKTSLIHSLLDTTECATFTEIMAPQNAPPMVIGTQIRYAGSKITKMETIFNVRENGMFSNPALTYSYAVKENRGPIPQDKRDSRAVLKGIADAYFDKFTNGSIVVPHHTPCDRIEGSMRVTPDCTSGIFSNPTRRMTNRRFVIDEEAGSVSVFLWFNGENGMADSHEFRVEGGKLRYVHAIMVPGAAKGKSGKGLAGKGFAGKGM